MSIQKSNAFSIIGWNDSSIKRLYHGSLSEFNTIDVNMGRGFKDFGKGFYTTENIEHAIRLAKRNLRIEEDRMKRQSNKCNILKAYLYELELDFMKLRNYKVKVFNSAGLEWLDFVVSNRRCKTKSHEYDVVIGPTADDSTKITFNAYSDGLYGDPKSALAKNILIQMLEVDNLPYQIYFGNNKIANEIKVVGMRVIQ